MGSHTDSFDLAGLRLSSGEGRDFDLTIVIDPLQLGTETYGLEPAAIPARLQISRTTGQGYALRLRFTATLGGPCMRCLEPAAPSFAVDAREVSQPGAGEELDSPYVREGSLDLRAWARDALVLMLPSAILCREDCAGLCAVCGENLNILGADHRHEPAPDSRWAKLSELKFED